jgi:hypothetical protein
VEAELAWRISRCGVDQHAGAKLTELSVQQPTNSDLLINLKTAKTFGLKSLHSAVPRVDDKIQDGLSGLVRGFRVLAADAR